MMNQKNNKIVVLAVVATAASLIFGAKAFNNNDSWGAILYDLFIGVSGSALVSLFTVLLLLFLQGNDKKNLEIDSQDTLYGELIHWIKQKKRVPKKITFIHHSGFVLINQVLDQLICLDTEIYLYQQTSKMWDTLNLVGDTKERLSRVEKEMHRREVNRKRLENRHKARLHIKRFRSPASLRAILVDDEALIISWYLYYFDPQNEPKTGITGSENPGILLFRGSPEFQPLYEMLVRVCEDLDRESVKEGEEGFKKVSELIYTYDVQN